MNTPKTDDQINAEITALEAARLQVRQFTAFGDNNHDAIDAQLSVLRERLSMDQVHDRFGEDAFLDEDEFDQHALDCAIEALDWLTGASASSEAPSASWSTAA